MCTRAGGPEAYFDDGEVHYVPIGDAPSLQAALAQMASEPGPLAQQVIAARAKMAAALGADNFVRRYVALSRELLDQTS